MDRLLVIAANAPLVSALGRWLAEQDTCPELPVEGRCVDHLTEHDLVSEEFEATADWIERTWGGDATASGRSDKLIVLTDLAGYDSFDWSRLNPVARGDCRGALLGMLILAFPEAHWVFFGSPGPVGWTGSEIHIASDIARLRSVLGELRHGVTALFDGTGLREQVRRTMLEPPDGLAAARRSGLAIAIDDERSFAFLHAYTSYRFGFRAYAAVTDAGMLWALNKPNPPPDLVFEDLFLQFADRHRHRFSVLRVRDEVARESGRPDFRLLSEVPTRIIVTSGHRQGGNNRERSDNPLYLRELRAAGQWNIVVEKPLGGIFNLWREARLATRLRGGGRLGLAAGFNWPLAPNQGSGDHSTPGRLLAVANRLVDRAASMIGRTHTVSEAVRGAVLAVDAGELLGGRTPTTSLQALALKHTFESMAECDFVGLREHIDVESRMEDIQREVDVLSQWFGSTKSARKQAAWNAELAILGDLIDVFNRKNQFDEEMALQVRTRQLNRKLWAARLPAAVRPIVLFPWYAEKLLESFPLFLGAIATWVVALGLMFHLTGGVSLDRGIADALTSFLGVQPPSDDGLWKSTQGWNGAFSVIALAVTAGVFHLGILISHLYSLISRR